MLKPDKKTLAPRIRVSFIGATSITAQFGLKILLNHPACEIKHLVSETSAGRKVSDIFPELAKKTELVLEPAGHKKLINDSDIIFLFKQHGKSVEKTKELIEEIKKSESGCRVIDLSADFRLQDKSAYPEYYNMDHPYPEFLNESVYGLPELNAEKIKNAFFIANPGCYPTSVILASAPLLKAGIVSEKGIIIESYSGISGAGRAPNEKNTACNVLDNLYPYKFNTHQHIPEIKQELSRLSGNVAQITFSPHVIPLNYGIFTTVYFDLKKEISKKDLDGIFTEFYGSCPFVRIMPEGIYPEIKNVAGTNYCDLSAYPAGNKKVAVMSVLDNIIKGASGQAIQNMNLMFNLPETLSLEF